MKQIDKILSELTEYLKENKPKYLYNKSFIHVFAGIPKINPKGCWLFIIFYFTHIPHTFFYIDLLFYHRGLQCLVAFELKADKFKPDHLGQLNFYLEALDRDVKKQNENPSIGVLLCKDKDSEVVEYALSRSLSPTMVSEYKTQLPDKKLLQQKLHELFDNQKINE